MKKALLSIISLILICLFAPTTNAFGDDVIDSLNNKEIYEARLEVKDDAIVKCYHDSYILSDDTSTCISSGIKTYICTKCKEEVFEPTNPKSHVYERVETYDYTIKEDSYIVNQVYYLYKCKSCSESYLGNYQGKPLERNYMYYTKAYDTLGALDDGNHLQALYDEINIQCLLFSLDFETDYNSTHIISVDYKKYGFTYDEIYNVWFSIIIDNPMYYFIDNSFSYSNGYLHIYTISEYKLAKNRLAAINTINNGINYYLDKVEGLSVVDTLKTLHDEMILNVDYGNANTPKTHRIIGLFERSGAVCESYATAFSLILSILGINNYYVVGLTKAGYHAWNLVMVDDIWYGFDLTWDDLGGQNIRYTYFGAGLARMEYRNRVAGIKEYKASLNNGAIFLYDVPKVNNDGLIY